MIIFDHLNLRWLHFGFIVWLNSIGFMNIYGNVEYFKNIWLIGMVTFLYDIPFNLYE